MRDFRRIKIDEDDIPPSRHALFFRGLDLHLKRDDIHKYFNSEIGSCNVIFYKERHETLCVAVRFDHREDATACFKRFEGKKVMNCSVDMQWYKDVRAYADKVEREFRYKPMYRKPYHNSRYNHHHHSKRSHNQHSSSRAVSISSDDSPKRKHRRRRSTSSGTNQRTRSSSRSSSASSGSSRSSRSRSRSTHRRSKGKKVGPHTPPQTPPLDQTEEFESSFVGPEFVKFDTIGENKNIALITLNRPNRQNAFCLPMLAELAEQFAKFENDRQIAAIILTGDKENFASGFDIADLKDLDHVSFEEEVSKNWKKITDVTKPLIAAVHGNALGVGFELALNCDIVYADTEAQFGFLDPSNGLIPGFGGTQLLTRLLGKSFTVEMCLTGTRLNAEEALKRTLISKTFPVDQLLDETIKLAEIIVKNPAPFNMLAKKSINYALDSLLQTGLTYEHQVFRSMLPTIETVQEEEKPTVVVESNNLNGTAA